MFERYEAAHPQLAASWRTLHRGDGLPNDLERHLPTWEPGSKAEATRSSSGRVINALADHLPTLWGGSADLAGSNMTMVSGQPAFSRERRDGRNLHYGVREHGMAAAMNGMALHGAVIPYGGTFLTFTDYMRGSMRLAALMRQRVVYILSHDSIFLGEDGPTHQSVEHAMALRQIPGLDVWRPGDGTETAGAWLAALRQPDRPAALLLTRQALPQLEGTSLEGVARGGYIVVGDAAVVPQITLIGTGSELHLCVAAAAGLASQGVEVRVVSMPSMERFAAQPEVYRQEVLPDRCPLRLSVEAGRTLGWQRFVGPFGTSIGIDRFGESAPAGDLAEFFGLTVANVANVARGLLGTWRQRARDHVALVSSLLGDG